MVSQFSFKSHFFLNEKLFLFLGALFSYVLPIFLLDYYCYIIPYLLLGAVIIIERNKLGYELLISLPPVYHLSFNFVYDNLSQTEIYLK